MYTAIHASCSSRSRTVQGESTNSRPGGACLMTSFTKSLDLKSPEINTCRKYGGVPPPCLLQSSFVKLVFTLCRFIVNRFSLPGGMDSPTRTASRDAPRANPQARDGARGAVRGENRKRRV